MSLHSDVHLQALDADAREYLKKPFWVAAVLVMKDTQESISWEMERQC